MKKLIRRVWQLRHWWNREMVPRYWSNQELRKIAPLFNGDIVNASAGDDVDKEGNYYTDYFSSKDAYFLTNYDPGAFRGYQGRPNEFLVDLTQDLPEELMGRFDVVFNHTTLEHIFEVRTAFRNLCLLTKDILIVVVPFIQDQHEIEGAYLDYWRFTPSVLRTLYAENGLQTIYEAVSPHQDTTTYLLFVGSKHPDRWQAQMPPYRPFSKVGWWVGRNHNLYHAPRMLLYQLSRRWRKAFL